MIFNQLTPGKSHWEDSEEADELRQACRKALASSAVTCRILSQHALDVLWWELDEIQPLLKVLPEYKEIESQSVSHNTVVLLISTRKLKQPEF